MNPHDRKCTCADHHSLDQFSGVEAGLDDVGATEECVSLVLFGAVRRVVLQRLVPLGMAWVGEVGLGYRNTLTWEG